MAHELDESFTLFNPLNANPEKWSKTFKQIVGNLPTICLSVFDHFMNLALKGLKGILCRIVFRIENRKSCILKHLLSQKKEQFSDLKKCIFLKKMITKNIKPKVFSVLILLLPKIKNH